MEHDISTKKDEYSHKTQSMMMLMLMMTTMIGQKKSFLYALWDLMLKHSQNIYISDGIGLRRNERFH